MANPLYDTLFGQHAGKTTPFLTSPDGTVMTHAAFVQLAAQYAHVFTDLGLTAGDRVAVQIDKSPQALAVYGACVQAGLIFLPLNPAYTTDEVSYFVKDSGAQVILCPDDRSSALKPLADEVGARLETMNATGNGSLSDKAAAMPTEFTTTPRSSDDLAAFLYTSGTTGRSKGAMLSQSNLLSNAEVLEKEWAHALPIFHTHGLFVATNIALLTGCQMVFLPKFDLDQIIAHIPKATSLMGVPTFYTRLLGDRRFTKDLTQDMRLFISGSAPLLTETHVQFEDRTGHRILERYGMTETNMNTSNPYEGERRAGTVGLPLPGVELKITDSKTGATLPQGEIGEIEVRGPNVFQGYWQMPEKTAEELRPDGFFITGDLGQIDALLLDQEEGVLESAVIGVPHPDFGETVVGILVAQDGETIDIEQITSNIAASLARYKQPQKLIVLPELPRNTMGKVQKKALRETFQDLFKPI